MRLSKTRAIAAVAAFAAAVTMAVPAQAATEKNGVVETGEFGLYYVPGSGTNYFNAYSGWVYDMSKTHNDLVNLVYGTIYFPGTWTRVNNNTASYRNRSTHAWWVATGDMQTGNVGCLPAGYVGDASYTFRNTITSAGPRSYSSC